MTGIEKKNNRPRRPQAAGKAARPQDQTLSGTAPKVGKISGPRPAPERQGGKQEPARRPTRQKQQERKRPAAQQNPVRQAAGKRQNLGSAPMTAAAQRAQQAAAQQAEKGVQPAPKRGRGRPRKSTKPAVKAYFLGGLNEIGKNFTLYECQNDMIIVDCGLAFPDEEMLGVDLVIPDFTFVEKNREKIQGIVITHGQIGRASCRERV